MKFLVATAPELYASEILPGIPGICFLQATFKTPGKLISLDLKARVVGLVIKVFCSVEHSHKYSNFSYLVISNDEI